MKFMKGFKLRDLFDELARIEVKDFDRRLLLDMRDLSERAVNVTSINEDLKVLNFRAARAIEVN